jgi:hypothetical protein
MRTAEIRRNRRKKHRKFLLIVSGPLARRQDGTVCGAMKVCPAPSKAGDHYVPTMAKALNAAWVDEDPFVSVGRCVRTTARRILSITVQICKQPAAAVVAINTQRKHVMQVRDEWPDIARKVLRPFKPRTVDPV